MLYLNLIISESSSENHKKNIIFSKDFKWPDLVKNIIISVEILEKPSLMKNETIAYHLVKKKFNFFWNFLYLETLNFITTNKIIWKLHYICYFNEDFTTLKKKKKLWIIFFIEIQGAYKNKFYQYPIHVLNHMKLINKKYFL